MCGRRAAGTARPRGDTNCEEDWICTESWASSFKEKEAPLPGGLIAGVGHGLIPRLIGRNFFLRSTAVAVQAADDIGVDISGFDRLIERLLGSAAFQFDLTRFAAKSALDLEVHPFLEGGCVIAEFPGRHPAVPSVNRKRRLLCSSSSLLLRQHEWKILDRDQFGEAPAFASSGLWHKGARDEKNPI